MWLITFQSFSFPMFVVSAESRSLCCSSPSILQLFVQPFFLLTMFRWPFLIFLSFFCSHSVSILWCPSSFVPVFSFQQNASPHCLRFAEQHWDTETIFALTSEEQIWTRCADSIWEWQLWVKTLWSLSWNVQRTITKRSYWSPQTGQVCGDLDKAAKKYTLRNKVSIMLQSVTAAPSDVRVWFMSLLVTLGVLVFSGERSPKFFKVSKGTEGCSFSKKAWGNAFAEIS